MTLRSFVVGLALALVAACAASAKNVTPQAAAQGGVSPSDCGGCHLREAGEWASSMHAQAFTDPFFAASYSAETSAFCIRCHAPMLPSRDGDTPEALASRAPQEAARGVGCNDCHGASGAPLARARTGRAPHDVTVDAGIGTHACERCHEFKQPSARDALQTTVSEHRASPFGDVACTACHMEGRLDHRYRAGVRNVERMKASIDVKITRRGNGTLEAELSTIGVGHAFPTGDLFRRLRLEVDALDTEGRTETRTELVLGRRFRFFGGERRDDGDDRVKETRRQTFDAPDGREDHLRYRLYYERGIAEHNGRFVVGDRTLLREGDVE